MVVVILVSKITSMGEGVILVKNNISVGMATLAKKVTSVKVMILVRKNT